MIIKQVKLLDNFPYNWPLHIFEKYSIDKKYVANKSQAGWMTVLYRFIKKKEKNL